MIHTTIVQHVIKPHDILVNELADRYESAGYTVVVSPSKSDLPPFLQPFHPDLIATRPDNSLVIEVRSKGKVRRSDYWHELQEVANANGWQLQLFINSPDEERESLSIAEIETIIAQVQTVAQNGALQAAMLLLWSALEASARIAMEKYNYPIGEFSTSRGLLTALFTNGLLDRETYESLLKYSEKRNHIVHGYRESVVLDDIANLTHIVRELLSE